MIEYKDGYFCCDECQICEGLEYRLRHAKKFGREPLLEYCGCDKVEYEFWLGGYCEDALCSKENVKKSGKRKTGRSYRRHMGKQKFKKKSQLGRYAKAISIGYPEYGQVRGPHSRLEPVGSYLHYPKNSKLPKYWKRYSNKVIRRSGDIFQNGNYRRAFDYWWEIY